MSRPTSFARTLFHGRHRYRMPVLIGLATLGTAVSCIDAQSVVSGRIALAPTLVVLAGGGGNLPSTTGGAATGVKLSAPVGVAVDKAGNFYIADAANNLVEQVTPAGQLVVIAGGGGSVAGTTLSAAISAKLSHPTGVAVDAQGNVYIADQGNNLVERVSNGQIQVLAGGGTSIPGMVQEPGIGARLNSPAGLAVDNAGDVFIADTANNLIEQVNAGGQIIAIAGGGSSIASTTIGPANGAKLSHPTSVAIDFAGNIYIADQGNNFVEKVTSGQIIVLAGGGSVVASAASIPATSAQLSGPAGVALDIAGNVYIVDQGNNLVDEVYASSHQIVAAVGGGAGNPGSLAVLATAVKLIAPGGLALDPSGNVYVADQGDNVVERVGGTQSSLPTTAIGASSAVQVVQIQLLATSDISSITVSAGANGTQEFTVGSVTGCTVGNGSNPEGSICIVPVTFTPAYPGLRTATLLVNNGNVLLGTLGLYGTANGPEVAQSPGSLVVIAGGGNAIPSATTATSALNASFANPTGIAADGAGNLYVVTGNNGNGEVIEISATTGQALVAAGGGTTVPSASPIAATSAQIYPFGVAVDSAGNLYIADYGNNVVDKVDATTKQLTVVAGGGGDGPSTTPDLATNVSIYPFGVAVDKTGNLYIADFNNSLVEEVVAGTNQIVIVAGGGYVEASAIPEPAIAAGFYQVLGVAVDGPGNLYIADAGDEVVEKVNVSDGTIIRIAGFGPNLPSTTPTVALNAGLNTPASVSVDPAGNVYIADSSNGQVEQVSAAGQIVVVAGGGAAIANSSLQSAVSARLNNPTGVVVDGAGNLFITDSNNNLVEKVNTTAMPLSFTSTNVGATNSSTQAVAIGNIGNEPLTIANLSAASDFPLSGSSNCTIGNVAQMLNGGTSCTLMYSFAPTVAGSQNEIAILTDNTLNTTGAQQNLSFTGNGVAPIVPVNPGSYSISANPTALTVKAGQPGTVTLTLTPVNGYTGSVTLNCTNLPANMVCTFSQSGNATAGVIAMSGNNQPIQIILTVQTNVPTQSAFAKFRPVTSNFTPLTLAYFWPLSVIAGLAGRRRKGSIKRRGLSELRLMPLMAFAALGLVAGCTGGSSSKPPSNAPSVETSMVTITSTASAGTTGLTESTTLILTVTQ